MQVWTPLTADASEEALLGLYVSPDWYAINQTLHQLKQKFYLTHFLVKLL